jgi:gamma-glutamylaminecyclotransferase
MLIFVYGTLKRGGSNHSWLEGQRFVGEAVTEPLFRLHDLDGYPGMVRDLEAGVSVRGEVWEVDAECLARLDELEDVSGGEYCREMIPLRPPFSQSQVQGYRYLREVAGRADLGGEWVENQQAE